MTTLAKQVPVTRNNTPKITKEEELITPEIAAELLGTRSGTGILQRNIDPELVSYYAREMKAGNWSMQYDPIQVSNHGFLMEGQHRLQAVIESGLKQEFFVIRGVDESNMSKLGIGKKRTPGNILHMNHHKNVNVLAATLRGLARYYDDGSLVRPGGSLRHRIPPYEYLVLAERFPGAVQAVSYAERYRKVRLVRSSVVSTLYYIFGEIDIQARNDFFARLLSGAGLEEGDPILLCREKLFQIREMQKRRGLESTTKNSDVLALIIKAWNAIRNDEKPQRLTFSYKEPFPMPV